MTIAEYIGIGTLVTVISGFVLRLYFYIDNKAKIIFGVLDKHRKEVKEDYVRKDICDVLHTHMGKDLGEVKEALIQIQNDLKILVTRLK